MIQNLTFGSLYQMVFFRKKLRNHKHTDIDNWNIAIE